MAHSDHGIRSQLFGSGMCKRRESEKEKTACVPLREYVAEGPDIPSGRRGNLERPGQSSGPERAFSTAGKCDEDVKGLGPVYLWLCPPGAEQLAEGVGGGEGCVSAIRTDEEGKTTHVADI